MEEQIVSLYSKLKSSLQKTITVSYYSWPNKYKKEKLKLVNVCGFSHITVCNSIVCKEFYFFGSGSMIESITIEGEHTPIYFNQYAKQFKSNGSNDMLKMMRKIKKAFLESININQIITPRESFLTNYYQIQSFRFDDLFFSEKQRKSFQAVFDSLTSELVKYAQKKGLDSSIKPIGKGSTSLVYSIGDKIIKIGKPRSTPMIPYCEYLLQPLLNRDFVFDGIPMHIEITQKVLTFSDLGDEGYTKFQKKLLQLQRKLYSIGLMCTDLHRENIGVLIQDNIIDFDEISFQIGNESATSIMNNNNLIVRKKGEFVIIDLDYIEIVNLGRYCKYLTKIGYDAAKIIEIKEQHKRKSKRQQTKNIKN